MGILRDLSSRFGIAVELVEFLWTNKLWWMIPLVVLLILFGSLIVFTQSSAVAPFIYTLF
ncbi:MAG: hypothetical protein HYY46_07120 [Deltaproteobacteria bacterium]|nr:hypothetical protein [Deltaproteobacteria bacterium]